MDRPVGCLALTALVDFAPRWQGEDMPYEDPAEHLRRTKDGREGFCQMLTTTLLVGGTYPKWGTENTLTEQGTVFFKALDHLSFGSDSWTSTPVFVDEITMPKRHDDELSASPDWTLIFEDRIWMIELKTERGSHRANQLPHYLDLASHHYPGRSIDVTYLTGPLTKPAPALRERQRYVHLTWGDVLPLYEKAWGLIEDASIRQYLDVVRDALTTLATPWPDWRTAFSGIPVVTEHVRDPLADALELAHLTAVDKAQRALDYPAQGVQELHDLRLELRHRIHAEPLGSPLRHVGPWVWTPKSLGEALSASGREQGAELRVSFYKSPIT